MTYVNSIEHLNENIVSRFVAVVRRDGTEVIVIPSYSR